MHSRDQSEVQRLLGAHARAGGQLGGVDLPNHVGELRPWRQALRIALLARPPGDGNFFRRQLVNHAPACAGDRMLRIVVHGRPRNLQVRNRLVKKPAQQPHQSALALPLFTEEKQVVLGQQRDGEIGDDGVVVAEHAGKQLVSGGERPEKVVVHLLLDALAPPAGVAKLAEVAWSGIGHLVGPSLHLFPQCWGGYSPRRRGIIESLSSQTA